MLPRKYRRTEEDGLETPEFCAIERCENEPYHVKLWVTIQSRGRFLTFCAKCRAKESDAERNWANGQ